MADDRNPTGRGSATRTRLLDAAADQLREHGLDGLRGPAVAEAAGVSEATVWHHLGTKAGLLQAVMERYYDALVEELAAVVDAADSPQDRLAAFARFWLHRMADDLPLVSEFQRHGRLGHDPELIAAFADCNRRVTRPFERMVEDLAAAGVLRGDVPARTVRDVFFGSAEHVLVGRALTGRDDDLDRAADALLDVLFQGVATAAVAHPIDSSEGSQAATLAAIEHKLDRLLEGT